MKQAAIKEEFLEPMIASLLDTNNELRRLCQEALLVFLKEKALIDHAKDLKLSEVLEARNGQIMEEASKADEGDADILEEIARLEKIRQLIQ